VTRTGSRCPVWRCLEFGSRCRVSRCLEFGTRSRVSRCLEFGTRSQSGRSQEKRASLPEQQRLASGNVSGKLIGASGTNPPSAPKRGKKWPGSGTHESGISPSKGGRFLACELRPIAPPTSRSKHFTAFSGCVPISGIDFVADDVRAVAEEHFWRVGLRGDGPSKVSLGFVLK
jgi:hypothetical protein